MSTYIIALYLDNETVIAMYMTPLRFITSIYQ
jgi:hypothetical protein